jgi:hypothetical protein
MKPKCDLCGSRHEPYQAHVFGATNRVRLTESATNTSATNRSATNGERDSGCNPKTVGVHDGGDYRGGGTSEKTANRRSRVSYNAYQREYMRKRREDK